jgi:AraC-like DNA-binding protein/DNA gyrase inhibitor GyrI
MGGLEDRLSNLSALVRYAQANLQADLSLAALSSRAGMTPFSLHRALRRFTGETPGRFVERLRLDAAATALLLREVSVLDIALEHGYRNPETFARAFRRRFGAAPSAFRAAGRLRSVPESLERRSPPGGPSGYELSTPRVQLLKPLTVLATRRFGPYEQVGPEAWLDVQQRCREHGLQVVALVGMGWDDPQTVAPEALRFDAGAVLEGGSVDPRASRGLERWGAGARALPHATHEERSSAGAHGRLSASGVASGSIGLKRAVAGCRAGVAEREGWCSEVAQHQVGDHGDAEDDARHRHPEHALHSPHGLTLQLDGLLHLLT